MIKKSFFSLVLLLFAGAGILFFQNKENFNFKEATNEEGLEANVSLVKEESKELKEKDKVENKIEDDITPKENEEKILSLPKKFKLEVDFTSQAPPVYGKNKNEPNWDHDHGEACEEASIIMAHYFFTKKKLTPEIADSEILAMLEFQEKNYSLRNKDLEAQETLNLAKDFYGYQDVYVKYDITIEDIKNEIYKGNPVILPTAGRELHNPYYRQPGPIYHMLIAIGWDDNKKEIITNDPGTKRGESFMYKYEVLENAIHEWNNGDVSNGRKAMIVIN